MATDYWRPVTDEENTKLLGGPNHGRVIPYPTRRVVKLGAGRSAVFYDMQYFECVTISGVVSCRRWVWRKHPRPVAFERDHVAWQYVLGLFALILIHLSHYVRP